MAKKTNSAASSSRSGASTSGGPRPGGSRPGGPKSGSPKSGSPKSSATKPGLSKPGPSTPGPSKPGASKSDPSRSGRAYWLFKTEPEEHSWAMQKARGATGEPWTGVRNFVARNNMQAMQPGDLGFFYHTGDERRIVGVVEVCAPAHPDATDSTGIWKCVDVRAVCDLPRPVTLAEAKVNPKLAGMALVKTTRLSVQPVTPAEWEEVCRMGGLEQKALAAKPG
jgi:predicted RNA-binding protein with PUA-like domain